MNQSKWLLLAGFTAMLGSSIAILLTAPFAIAYFTAYSGFDVPPFWIQPLKSVLIPILTFSSPVNVYNVYVPAKKWMIVASLASPQSRDFNR